MPEDVSRIVTVPPFVVEPDLRLHGEHLAHWSG